MKLRTEREIILPFSPIPCNMPNKDILPNVLEVKSILVINASLLRGLFILVLLRGKISGKKGNGCFNLILFS